MLRIRVLGAAAGGGLPQWNCACECCRCARSGARGVRPQTQSSIAVSADGEHWVLLNASPDLRAQIEANPALQPRTVPRGSPIAAVVLTSADVDHVAGLLTLRERQPFALFATPRVHSLLARSGIFDVLSPDYVRRWEAKLEQPVAIEPELCRGLPAAAGAGRIEVRLFAVPGKLALYLESGERTLDTRAVTEDTVAAEICDPATGARCFYVPGCAALTPELRDRLRGAPLVLFDGTVFRDDELARQGLGEKTGGRMGHLSMSGERGSLAGFADLGVGRRIFVHINNSNPVWLEDSPERAAVHAAGWEIGRDGMEIQL
jgi:pyrroloquinoline quinone biosynthesis protein B